MGKHFVVCIDTKTPRIDGRHKKVTGITVGKLYEVVEKDGYFIRIINDEGESARYMAIRFENQDFFTGLLDIMEALIDTVDDFSDLENIYTSDGRSFTHQNVMHQYGKLKKIAGVV